MKCFPIFLIVVIGFLSACTYTIKIRDGKTAFDRKQYSKAITFFQKEYSKAERKTEKGVIAFYLAESYRQTNQQDKALPWYKTAYDNGYGVEAMEQYAYGLKQQERYEEALQYFEQLGLEIGSPYEYRKEITACKVAMEWLENPSNAFRIEPLAVNTGAAEFSPRPYKSQQILLTSDRNTATGEERYHWTGRNFMDFFLFDLKTHQVKPFSEVINSADNEGTASFNSDFSELYFTRCYGDENNTSYCKIMHSQLEDSGEWSMPKALEFQEANVNYMHPALSADGNLLYFASDHSSGWGGYDIYVTEQAPDGWDTPRLLSRSINTPGNEAFPFVDADTLYFSSDNHTGMGGLDIFKVYKLNSDTWSSAYNLKPPINSGADDFGIAIDYRPGVQSADALQTGYFTSTRPVGSGQDDIFKFEKIIPPVPPEPKPDKPVVYKLYLNGFVLEKIFKVPDNPNSKVLGRKPLENAEVVVSFRNEERKFSPGPEGYFTLELESGLQYNIFASKKGYLNREKIFSTEGIGKDPNNPIQTFDVEIVLDKIYKNKEIVLEDIYYDFDKWDIRPDAEPTLNKLAEDLKLNPEIKIQLASHTDCRGNENYNLELSQKRAQAAVNYLISKGIDKSRLAAVGYGESRPAVICICARCTEEQHQANRRTTFTIME